MCLDFDLGPNLFDASPRPPSGKTCLTNVNCDPADPLLAPWEECINDVCVPITSDYGEDYGRWEGLRPFDGSRYLVRVSDTSDNVLWGWQPLDDTGCTGVFDDGGLDVEQLFVQRTRWVVTPAGHSILGYECELSNEANPMQAESDDGACQLPDFPGLVLGTGSASSDCLSTGADVDRCTQWTVTTLSGAIEPIDNNLWATTQADRRTNFVDPSYVYLLQETDTANNSGTSTGPALGGHTSIRFKFNQWHDKHSPAHEYGHAIAFNIPNRQGGHPTQYGASPDVDTSLGGDGHLVDSIEWQAACAVEGLANVVALATWNDLTEDDVVQYLDPAGLGGGSQLITLQERFDHPAASTSPCDGTVLAGRSCEQAWGSAMREFLRGPSPDADLETVLLMVTEAHAEPPYTWYPNGGDSDFADEFDLAMSAYLTTGEYSDWSSLAVTWGLDQ